MEHKEEVEQLFKSTFDNFEADVNPDAWMNIQNALKVPAMDPGSISNNVSAGTKLAAVSSKFIIGAVSAIIGITAAVVYFSPGNKTTADSPVPKSEKVQNIIPVEAAATEKSESNPILNTVSLKKEKQAAASNETISNAENPELQPDHKNNNYSSSTNEEVVVADAGKKNSNEVSEDKIIPSDAKIPDSRVQAAPLTNDENKLNENEPGESGAGNNDVSEPENSAIHTDSKEKNAEEYLGHIPNVITPNTDGENDVFIIEGKDLKTLKVSIADRSGKIIHQWNNLHGFWDGKLENGEPAKAGIYFYNIFAQSNSGNPIVKHGTLHLLLK